jgi:hypothetical protein
LVKFSFAPKFLLCSKKFRHIRADSRYVTRAFVPTNLSFLSWFDLDDLGVLRNERAEEGRDEGGRQRKVVGGGRFGDGDGSNFVVNASAGSLPHFVDLESILR